MILSDSRRDGLTGIIPATVKTLFYSSTSIAVKFNLVTSASAPRLLTKAIEVTTPVRTK
jgi:hypothetical protein